MAWAEWTLMLPGPVTGMTDQMFSSQATAAVISMNAFDYSTVAELFPSKSDAALRPATNQRQRRRQPVGYGRFARAGYAIRFAIEELPAELLSDTCLKVDEQIFDGHAIRRLYDSEDYPLVRRPSPLQASNVKPFSSE